MDRRKFLIGAGSLAAGGAAAMGSGAFDSAEAGREVEVSVVHDSNGFLALNSTSPYSDTDNGELKIYFNEEAATGAGDGVPQKTNMVFGDVFEVRNQGTQRVEIGLDQNANGSEESFNIRSPGPVGGNGFEQNRLTDDNSDGDRIDVAYSYDTNKAFNQGPGTKDPDSDGSIELAPGETAAVDFAIRTDDDLEWFSGNGLATLVITAEEDTSN